MAFVPSWSPEHAGRAEARLDVTGRYCLTVPKPPTRKAVSLSRYRLNYYVQGSVGVCWTISPKQLFEVRANVKGYHSFPASSRAIGYAAKQLFEGGDNQAEGGSPTDALITMTSKGIGIPHEALCPFTEDYNLLGQKPSDEVYRDAAKTRLLAPVKVESLDEIPTLIDRGIPVAQGFPCPDTLQDPPTFLDSCTDLIGGHSVLIWGYALPGVFDQYGWYELENWWDKMYLSLPPELAKLVDGYEPVTPSWTTSKWMRMDLYHEICRANVTEHVGATDIQGIADGTVRINPSFVEAFSI